jgi:hypothetical protein
MLVVQSVLGPAHAAGGAIVERLALLVLTVATIRHPFRGRREQLVGRGDLVVAGDELNLVPAIDFHAGNGLEDGQNPVEDDVRALLGIEQGLVGVAPLLARAKVEIILGLDVVMRRKISTLPIYASGEGSGVGIVLPIWGKPCHATGVRTAQT